MMIKLDSYKINKIQSEPFRLFFGLGAIVGIIGVLYWPILIYGMGLQSYPTEYHAYFLILGFFPFFSEGFLLTAFPRLTQTSLCTLYELFFFLLMRILVVVAMIFQRDSVFSLAFVIELIVFTKVLLFRYLTRKRAIPPSFILVFVSLLSGIIGSILIFYSEEYIALGKQLLFEDLLLINIIAVGGHLIVSIFNIEKPSLLKKNNLYLLLGSMILISDVIQHLSFAKLGLGIKSLLLTMGFMIEYELFRTCKSQKLAATTIKIALVTILLGYWGQFIFYPDYYIGFRHLILIGGFVMITISLASRVCLAHSDFVEMTRFKNKVFTFIALLIFISAWTRLSADILLFTYRNHLIYAASLWALALMIWLSYFYVKIFIKKK